MGGSPTTPRVLAVLNSKFNGKAVTLDQLTRATGLTDSQVQHVMARLVADEHITCAVVTRGRMWKYGGVAGTDDQGQIADTLFEVVGVSAKDNDTVVRGDVSGKLYKVVAL